AAPLRSRQLVVRVTPPKYHFPAPHLDFQNKPNDCRPPALPTRPRHIEPAERMHVHHRAGAFAVDIKIADVEFAFRAFDALAVARIERAGQTVDRVVGDLERVVNVFGFDDGEHGTEDLFLREARFRIDIGDDSRRNEPAFAGQFVAPAPRDYAAILLADLDVLVDLFVSAPARNRPGEIIHVFDRADSKFAYALGDFGHDLIVDRINDHRARAGRAFLARISEGRSDDACRGFIKVRRFINDDGVFAAHFGHDAFDPDLPIARFGGQLVDAQAHSHRTGERDEARLRMFDQIFADRRAFPRQEVDDAGRE